MIKKIFLFLLFCSYTLMAQDTTSIVLSQEGLDTLAKDYSVFKKIGFTYQSYQGLFFYETTKADELPEYICYIPTNEPFTAPLEDYAKRVLASRQECYWIPIRSGIFNRRNKHYQNKLQKFPTINAKTLDFYLNEIDTVGNKSIAIAYGLLSFNTTEKFKKQVGSLSPKRIRATFKIQIKSDTFFINCIDYGYVYKEIGSFEGFDKIE